jgi:predicted site-specific integrase-resolvase
VAEGKIGRPPNDEYMSPREAAEWLTAHGYPGGISGRTVTRYCKSEQIAAKKTPGGWYRIRRSVVEDFLRTVLDTRDTTA